MTTEAARRLGLDHPIVQGPFGGGLSSPLLASSVSNLGGLGSYGIEHLAPEDILKLAADIRARTAKPFNLNLWVSVADPGGEQLNEAAFERLWPLFEPYYRELGVAKPEPPQRLHAPFEDQFEAMLEAAPAVFSFVFGIPTADQMARCRKRGILTVGTATTIAEAVALEEAGCDAIVVTGLEAGGHRVSFLKSSEESLMGTFSLTQIVAPRVKVPVIAAGGIVDARGVKAALVLGAAGVQVGTAFLACDESGASPEHRAALFSERTQRTVLTRTYSGRLARGIHNRLAEEMPAHVAPYPIQAWFLNKLKPAARAQGRTDLVSVWCGQSAPNLKHRNVPALMAELTNI
ncbi:MAG: NAD(P)H-dependent flavin oxidoreductase [Rhodospirillaceae bacterium]